MEIDLGGKKEYFYNKPVGRTVEKTKKTTFCNSWYNLKKRIKIKNIEYNVYFISWKNTKVNQEYNKYKPGYIQFTTGATYNLWDSEFSGEV